MMTSAQIPTRPELPQRGLVIVLLFAVLTAHSPVAAEADGLKQARLAVEANEPEKAADILASWLADHPGDHEARFLYARALSWTDQRPEALEQYDRLLDASPNNTDYLVGKAQVLIWEKRASEAIPLLERARARAPDYQDVWRLEIQALLAAEDPELQERAFELAEEASQRFPESAWNIARNDDSGQTKLAAGFSHEFLSGDFSDWRSIYIAGDHQLPDRKLIYGTVRATERFDINDQEIVSGAYLPIGNRWTAMVEASLGPGAEVLPKWSASGQIARSLREGWGIQLSIRHSEYQTTYNDLLALTGERYWGDWRGAYTLFAARPGGIDTIFSNSLQFDRYYGQRNRAGVIYSIGKEAESVGGDNLLVSDVQALSISGRHWISKAWAISWAAIYHDQGDIYTRTGFNIGLWHEF